MTDKHTDAVDEFWNVYQADGIEKAVVLAKERTDGNLLRLEEAVPYLIQEMKARDIDVIKFLSELDEVEGAMDHADGATDDALQLPADSSDDDGIVEDEAEPAEERAPDQQADAETEES